jgi:ABC-type iron transport system FetAB ATPase subunit
MRVCRSNHTVYTINYHFVWCQNIGMTYWIESSLEQSIRYVDKSIIIQDI